MKISLFVLSMVLTGSVQAGIVTYTDKSTFLNAVGSTNATMTYDSNITGDRDLVSSHTENGVTINNLIAIINNTYGSGIYNVGSGAIAQSGVGETSTVSYTENFYAAGFSYFTVQPDGNHAGALTNLTLSTGDVFSLDTSGLINGDALFFGFTSDEALTSFSLATISGSGADRRWLNTDDVMISTSAVPVPAAVWLFGSGLIGLVGIRRNIFKLSTLSA